MSLRVLHIAHGLVFGGIERVLAALAVERAHAPAMEPEFALCFAGRTSAQLAEAGALVHILGGARISRPWTVLRARTALQRVLQQRRPQVVVVHGSWAHGLLGGIVRRLGIPLVAVAHSPYGARHWTERLAAHQTPDLVIANSRFTGASAAHAFAGVPSVVFYPPVSCAQSRWPGEGVRPSIRSKLSVSDDVPVVLMACRLDAYKGHDVLIRAASSPICHGIQFWIAGGPQTAADQTRYAYLKRLVAQYQLGDRVKFLGQRDDIPALMAAADIFCQPNVGPEPFGVVFIEALLAGLPVITSAIGGGAEIVDSSCGRLTPPGDASAVSQAISDLVRNPVLRASLASAGPARGRVLCDPAIRIPELANILASIVKVPSSLAEFAPA
jgi:glycosyltransferase involved in cell wall biosynthesis